MDMHEENGNGRSIVILASKVLSQRDSLSNPGSAGRYILYHANAAVDAIPQEAFLLSFSVSTLQMD
jgi:hypothetical protein